jgi:hypothetical protein
MSVIKRRQWLNESVQERQLRHVRRCSSLEELEALERGLRERGEIPDAVKSAIWDRKHVERLK